MAHTNYRAKLLKQQVASQATIDGQLQTLEKLNAQIIQAKEDQEKANNEKLKLDNKTQTLQKEKDQVNEEIKNLEEKKIQAKKDLA